MSEWKTAGKVRMTPKGVYSPSAEYEVLDIVTNADKTTSYVAKKTVPAETELSNTEYWIVLSDVSEAVANANDAMTYIAITETSPATSSHPVGQFLIYDGNLYSVKSAINIDDELVVDTNITLISGGFTNDLSDNLIKVQNSQPTEATNKIWFDTSNPDEITVPDYEEFEELIDDLSSKAEIDGNYEYLAAGSARQIISSQALEDFTPYLYRNTCNDADVCNLKYLDKIIGGTVAWNQLVGDESQSVTIQNGHKYLTSINDTRNIGASTGSGISIVDPTKDNVFDITVMFGSTIADYIYSLEQSTTGAGVTWFRNLFPEDYYEYNPGELISVEGVSAHVTRNADGDTIGNYPLDSSLILRGIPKLDSSNRLYFDGDTYESDGTVTRKYNYYTFTGADNENWEQTVVTDGQTNLRNVFASSNLLSTINTYNSIMTNAIQVTGGGSDTASESNEITCRSTFYQSQVLYVFAPPSQINSLSAFKSWLSANPLEVVYELATPTIESAQSYQQDQVCDSLGTEEFVSTGFVPVAHNTRYYINLRDRLQHLPDPAASDGTYAIQQTGTSMELVPISTPSVIPDEDAAAAAAASATEAAESATEAAQSASSAGDSAAIANGSASDAINSASSAARSASSAGSSASDAASSAQDAAESAQTALEAVENIESRINNLGAYGEVGPLPIVSITDALPLDAEKVIVNIKPVQEGSGDPSPDNVRPITGWTSAKVTKRSDKNLLPTKLYKTDLVSYGEQLIFTEAPQQLTDEGDGVYSITATKEQEKYLMLAPIGEASHLFFKVELESTGEKRHMLCLLDDSYVIVSMYMVSMSTGGTPSSLTHYFDLTDNPTAKYFVYEFSNSSTAGAKLTITKPQLEVGSAATDYEPHSGYSYDISFSSRTIYGGTIDVLNGKLTQGMSLVDLGTLDWKYDQAMGAFYSDSSYRAYVVSDEDALCSNYLKLENPTEESIGNSNNIIVINRSQFGNKYIERIVKGAIIIKDTRYTDVNTFKTAMSGVQVVYKTTSPYTYDLSDSIQIALLRGENTLWANCGDITVGYWRDDELSINKAISERVPKITQIDETMTEAEYNALTSEQKMDGTIRFISDGNNEVLNIDKMQSGLAIIVDGDTASMAVPVGSYAYIKNNTHGLAEGLYTNTGSSAFPATGGTADSTVFTSVSGGGLNAIQQSMAIVQEWTPVIPRITMSDITKNKLIKNGNIVYCFATFKVVTAQQNANVYIDETSFPTFDKTRGICTGMWTDSSSANDECGLIVGAVNLNGWLKYGTGSTTFTNRVGHTVTISLSYPIF